MKMLIIIVCSMFAKLNAEEYIVPKNVVDARNAAVKSVEKFREKLVNRYFKLSQKKELSTQEKDELTALEIVIFEKDSSLYLNNRLKKYKKKK